MDIDIIDMVMCVRNLDIFGIEEVHFIPKQFSPQADYPQPQSTQEQHEYSSNVVQLQFGAFGFLKKYFLQI